MLGCFSLEASPCQRPTPQADLILDKSGKPFKDKTISLAVAQSIKRGRNVEAVQIGPNQWGMRPVVDEAPKVGGQQERAAVEQELRAAVEQELRAAGPDYDAMREKADALIDAGQNVDMVYDVLAGMEKAEAAAPVQEQEAPQVAEKPYPEAPEDDFARTRRLADAVGPCLSPRQRHRPGHRKGPPGAPSLRGRR